MVKETQMKQTEIGLIPEDWEVVTIQEISNPVRGGSPRPAGSPLYFNGNYIPWLTVASLTNISKSKIFVTSTESFLTELGSNYSRNLKKGTLIISNSGATLGVAKILDIDCCANDGIAALLELNANNKYIAYYINTLTDHLRNNIATGNGQPNLNTELIGNLQIPLPPLAEQEAIAAALSDCDGWIESLEAVIAKKRLIKQGAMQELLTPPSTSSGSEGTPNPELVEGWEVKKLGEVGEIITGGTPSTLVLEYWNGDIPWITPTDINIKKNIYFGERNLTISGVNQIKKLRKNSLLVTCIASIGKNAILRVNGACNQQINAITPNAHFSVDYLYYLLELSKKILIGKAGTTATLMLSKAEFSLIEFRFPILAEQTRIATVLSDMDAELDALGQKLNKARQIKQGMMQELLTGRVRLM